MNKYVFRLGLFALSFSFAITSASAHVTVAPDRVGVGVQQLFQISIPSEKDGSLSTMSVRLVLPKGLMDVTPIIQPGWKITTQKTGEDVVEINWAGGEIPAGQGAIFSFLAQVPPLASSLIWRAYQTYSDGSVISWDQVPAVGRGDNDSVTLYSDTQVINDLAVPPPRKCTPVVRITWGNIGAYWYWNGLK
jgi:uncharacterized protein YcnI